MKLVRYAGAFLAGLLLLLWRLTCRYVVHAPDPRPAWRAEGRGYIYALLHAHQLAAIFINDDPKMVAMVSRSADGDFLVPPLWLRRVRTVRGSSRKAGKDKGGREALGLLIDKARAGWPALIAVDGPRGPRTVVQPGAAKAAISAGCPILPVVVVPTRRWILSRAWDRFQIPKPFARVDMHFGEPLFAAPTDDPSRVTAEVQARLLALERAVDPVESPAAVTAPVAAVR